MSEVLNGCKVILRILDEVNFMNMNTSKAGPHFSYNLSSSSKKNFGCIVADGFIYHRVADFDEFYRVLGYTESMRKTSSVLPDEFIWDWYVRDNDASSTQCLQSKIKVYLYKHSARFVEEFGAEYEGMLGQCASDKMDDSAICVACPMHPPQLHYRLRPPFMAASPDAKP
ncbi:MAG: hypothetical protein K8H84_04345 [Sulfuricella denitrificans]|nr:hypothetical protein [Sulfuricella denitrificans]